MEVDSNHGDLKKLAGKNLQIRLMGHCIICLRKVNAKRQGNRNTSEYFKSDDGSSQLEKAPKSVITGPGFLATFNQVWTVLYTKLKDKKNGNDFSEGIEIPLESVLQDGCVSSASFSRPPTICQLCCDKVLAVENLMKAVKQQVREISMLLEQGRRRQDGGLGDFEQTLWENGLEENVIMATLQFVGSFGGSRYSEVDAQELKVVEGSATEVNLLNMIEMECDEENSLVNSQMGSYDNNEDQTEGVGDEEDDEDPDYIKSEEELEEDDDEEESEDEMEMEEEDKTDTDTGDRVKVKKDPLASIPNKRKKEDKSFPKKWANQFGSGEEKQANPEGEKVPCTCGKTFKNRKSLRWHMKKNKEAHPDYENYGRLPGQRQVCELCGEWVMHTDILQHLTDHLNGQAEWVMRCPNDKCPFLYVSKKQFQLHFHKDQRKECRKIWKERCGHFCDVCGFKGTSLLKIRYHYRDKHEDVKGAEKTLKCPISGCGKMFCVKQSVHFHLDEHRYRPAKTEQLCDKCGKSLKVEEMEGHLKEEHGVEEVIGCKQCPFKFGERDEMVEHLNEHRRTGIFCDICEMDKFDKYTDFREHYFGVHKLCPKKYKCGEEGCDKWYWRIGDKRDHELRTHKGADAEPSLQCRKAVKKDFECDLCNVKFYKGADVITHKIKVHGADPLKCDTCGETFNDKVKFNKHMKEHAGIPVQKEWRCEVEGCGKVFEQNKNFKRHKEVGHGGVKPHVCEICGKGYKDACGLKAHRESVHLGLRPWECEECGEGFSNGTTLKRHMLIHTGERPFVCEICGQRFRHKEVLRRHKVAHEEKGDSFKPNGPMKQIRKRKAM